MKTRLAKAGEWGGRHARMKFLKRAGTLGEIFEVREILWRGGELKKKMRDNVPEMREGPGG